LAGDSSGKGLNFQADGVVPGPGAGPFLPSHPGRKGKKGYFPPLGKGPF
jgi:hypothetical protein